MKLKPFVIFSRNTRISFFAKERRHKPGITCSISIFLVQCSSTTTFPVLCCNTHRAASSSSFSTGEMEKKQSRRKSQEHPTVCAALAVPAEPSCGDAAYSRNNVEFTRISLKTEVFLLQPRRSEVQKSKAVGGSFLFQLGQSIQLGQTFMQQNISFTIPRVIYNISHLSFQLKICLVSHLN